MTHNLSALAAAHKNKGPKWGPFHYNLFGNYTYISQMEELIKEVEDLRKDVGEYCKPLDIFSDDS